MEPSQYSSGVVPIMHDLPASSRAASPAAVGDTPSEVGRREGAPHEPATKRRRIDDEETATHPPPSAPSSAFLPQPTPIASTSRLPYQSQGTPRASPAATPQHSPATDSALLSMRERGASWDTITAQTGRSLGYCQARYSSLVDGTATPRATPAPLAPVHSATPGASTPAPVAGAARAQGAARGSSWQPWTAEETRILVEAKERGKTIAEAALLLPGRTPGACQQQWYKARRHSNGLPQASQGVASPSAAPTSPFTAAALAGASAASPTGQSAAPGPEQPSQRRYTAAEDAQIYARYNENWSFAEVAQEIGRSEAGVAKRYYKVKKKLQAGPSLSTPDSKPLAHAAAATAPSPSGSPASPIPGPSSSGTFPAPQPPASSSSSSTPAFPPKTHPAGQCACTPAPAPAPEPAPAPAPAPAPPALVARAKVHKRRWSGYGAAVEALRRLRAGDVPARGGAGAGEEREGRGRVKAEEEEEVEVDQLDGEA